MLKLHNTLTNRLEPFTPIAAAGKDGEAKAPVRLYVCGPTVYDDAHLGHARCYITWDVLFRFLRFLNYDVTYVRNITDVDDKIINRAREENTTPDAIAETYYQRFSEDMACLNVLQPTREPRATEFIQTMFTGIERMMESGNAYATPDGTVYFRVASKPDYGQLKFQTRSPEVLRQRMDELQAGARVEVDPHKESPLDFALWKAVSGDDPDAWESPWGRGRPGWHMECSAMNHDCLGDQIDIHAGGADLIFPHHENEIAQSESWTGKAPFAKYWLHNGFVNVSGEKMSKSLGNFATVRTMLERYDANTIRYFLLQHHYRSPVDFNDVALESSVNAVKRMSNQLGSILKTLNLTTEDIEGCTYETYSELLEALKPISDNHPTHAVPIQTACQQLANDLNSAIAVSKLREIIGELNVLVLHLNEHQGETNYANTGLDYQAYIKLLLSAVLTLFNVLGFSLVEITQPQGTNALPKDALRTIYCELTGKWNEADQAPEAWLATVIEMRKTAKATKNWTQADAIRKHLSDIGIQLMDNKDGTTTYEIVSPTAAVSLISGQHGG